FGGEAACGGRANPLRGTRDDGSPSIESAHQRSLLLSPTLALPSRAIPEPFVLTGPGPRPVGSFDKRGSRDASEAPGWRRGDAVGTGRTAHRCDRSRCRSLVSPSVDRRVPAEVADWSEHIGRHGIL